MTDWSAQRALTAAYIADDPTAVAFIPRVRALNAAGAPVDTDGAPRTVQTVKLILLNFDQRPIVTLAGGVERVVDYHMLMLFDAVVAVGDYWEANGNRYEVVGMTDGHKYEIKAFVSTHVPRTSTP